MPTREQERKSLNRHPLLSLHHKHETPRVEFARYTYELWIREEYNRCTYEIVSSGTVLARGTAVSEFAALATTVPLLNMLNLSR
jgi:hypothetical protein